MQWTHKVVLLSFFTNGLFITFKICLKYFTIIYCVAITVAYMWMHLGLVRIIERQFVYSTFFWNEKHYLMKSKSKSKFQ